MKPLKIIVLAILFILTIVVVLQNHEVFTHEFELGIDLQVVSFGPFLAKNLLLQIIAFIFGVLFAVMWGAFHAGSLRRELREARQKTRELENKLSAALKSPPPPPAPTPVAVVEKHKTSESPFGSPSTSDADDD